MLSSGKKIGEILAQKHVNYFSKKTIRLLLEEKGFKSLKIKSSFEFKLFLMYGIFPMIKKIKSKLAKNKSKSPSAEAEKQQFFNKTTSLPRWLLKIIMVFHNLIYNTMSFIGIGDEMMVVAKKLK